MNLRFQIFFLIFREILLPTKGPKEERGRSVECLWARDLDRDSLSVSEVSSLEESSDDDEEEEEAEGEEEEEADDGLLRRLLGRDDFLRRLWECLLRLGGQLTRSAGGGGSKMSGSSVPPPRGWRLSCCPQLGLEGSDSGFHSGVWVGARGWSGLQGSCCLFISRWVIGWGGRGGCWFFETRRGFPCALWAWWDGWSLALGEVWHDGCMKERGPVEMTGVTGRGPKGASRGFQGAKSKRWPNRDGGGGQVTPCGLKNNKKTNLSTRETRFLPSKTYIKVNNGWVGPEGGRNLPAK